MALHGTKGHRPLNLKLWYGPPEGACVQGGRLSPEPFGTTDLQAQMLAKRDPRGDHRGPRAVLARGRGTAHLRDALRAIRWGSFLEVLMVRDVSYPGATRGYIQTA